MNRKEKLATDEYYHIFNRGVDKGEIFADGADYRRFILTIFHYLSSNEKLSYSLAVKPTYAVRPTSDECDSERPFVKPVELAAYCLINNHFHLLLKQVVDRGITTYMHRVTTSFTNYFNKKRDRVGPLLQGRFKSKRVETEEQLLYITKYIHRNPLVLFETSGPRVDWDGFLDYPWSSLANYLGKSEEPLYKENILASFPGPNSYQNFFTGAYKVDEVEKSQLLNIDN